MNARPSERIAVVTTVAGRHDHLRAQHHSLLAGHRRPDVVIVVSMGDPDVSRVVAGEALAGTCDTRVDRVEPVDGLPLAAARNLGAARASEAGADLVVFLDVDCLAGDRLLASYATAADRVPRHRPNLLAGAVSYLPPLQAGRTSYDADALVRARPHPARPAPAPGTLRREADLRLFWSLSFAVTPDDWLRIGGFDEAYTGYGAEDTDLGQRARASGARLWWVGGADAYHQWHPVSDPPVEHLDAVITNANRFHQRWGWFPMEGWLAAFEARGLAHHDPAQDRWVPGPGHGVPRAIGSS